MKYKIKVLIFIICSILAVTFIVIPAVQINMQNKKHDEEARALIVKKKKEKIEQTAIKAATDKTDTQYHNKELEDKYKEGLDAFNKKQYYDAINIENEVVALDDKFYEAYNIMGLSYCYIKKYNESMAYIEKALSIKEDYTSAILSKAICYETFAHYDEAIIWYNKSLLMEDNPFCYYGLAGSYASKGNSQEAISNLKIAIEKDPTLKDRVKNDLDFVSLKNLKEFTDIIK